MGTWGYGNFDSDGAQDYLHSVVHDFSTRIEKIFEEDRASIGEDGDDVLMPTVEIISLLVEQLGGSPPYLEYVIRWKEKFLEIFDEEEAPIIDMERRAVIVATFEKLEKQSKDYWQQDEQFSN